MSREHLQSLIEAADLLEESGELFPRDKKVELLVALYRLRTYYATKEALEHPMYNIGT